MINFLKIIFISFLLKILIITSSLSENNIDNFDSWLNSYKIYALKEGISEKTLEISFKNVKYLEQVIKYDRKQPEFFETTDVYVKKRANDLRVKIARKLLKENEALLNEIEKKFSVEKEILLALWGIETNFGKHVGKMDIISCLATLSYDKRRSKFFSEQLLTLLKLIDKGLIDPNVMYGSWAGAYGNFQFMPSTIERYAIDYDGNNKIELKTSIKESFASAANYISSIGWAKGEPCFYKVKIPNNINKKYINVSARKISQKLTLSKWSNKGLSKYDGNQFNLDLKAALIQPDGKPNTPSFLVFRNYEKILNWNRSLRFGISVCTLANKIKI